MLLACVEKLPQVAEASFQPLRNLLKVAEVTFSAVGKPSKSGRSHFSTVGKLSRSDESFTSIGMKFAPAAQAIFQEPATSYI